MKRAGSSLADDSLPTHLAASIHTDRSKRHVVALFRPPTWQVRKSSWKDYEVRSPCADLVIQADSPILLHGNVANLSAGEQILGLLQAAGIAHEGEFYEVGESPLKVFRWSPD